MNDTCKEAIWIVDPLDKNAVYCQYFGICKEGCPYPFGRKYEARNSNDK